MNGIRKLKPLLLNMNFELNTLSSLCFTSVGCISLPRRVNWRQHRGRSCPPQELLSQAEEGSGESSDVGFSTGCAGLYLWKLF